MLKTVAQTGSTGAVSYQGTWNASTNVPTLTSSVGTKGYYYLVSTPGNTNLNGISTWNAGDWAVFDGTVWERVVGGTPSTSFTLGNTVVTLGGTTTNVGNLTLANVTITSGSIPNSAITGLGTMAVQNANSVTITGGNTTVTYDNAAYQVATANIQTTTTAGAFSYGNLSYSYTGLVASFANSANSSIQFVIQNTNSSSNASTDLVVTNDTATGYLDMGMTSSTYSGSGNFYKANIAYVYSGSSDLYLGTVSSNAVHITANNASTDAILVNANNTVNIASLISANVAITGGAINVTTTNMTANVTANATFATSSLPLVPAGYIVVDLNGTLVKVPYYAV
jgi:hypothetical protein